MVIQDTCSSLYDKCQSELEAMFIHRLGSTDRGYSGVRSQVPMSRYRVDFLIDCAGKAVVVELDGKAYHNAGKDKIRDSVIIKSVDAIIRIPYAAMCFYEHATFRILAEWFDRFQKPLDSCCVADNEFLKEMADEEYIANTYSSTANFIEESDKFYQLWSIFNNEGNARSVKAFLNCYRVSPITIQRR